MYFNIWLAVSNTVRNAYHTRREVEGSGAIYSGPVTDKAYRVLRRLSDHSVETLFKNPAIGGKNYKLFSIYINRADAAAADRAISDLAEEYPTDIVVIGVWREDGTRVGAIHAQAWRFMPDEYDQYGDPIPATSNSDLRDINLNMGQAPRSFA